MKRFYLKTSEMESLYIFALRKSSTYHYVRFSIPHFRPCYNCNNYSQVRTTPNELLTVVDDNGLKRNRDATPSPGATAIFPLHYVHRVALGYPCDDSHFAVDFKV